MLECKHEILEWENLNKLWVNDTTTLASSKDVGIISFNGINLYKILFVPGKPYSVHVHLRELLEPEYQAIFLSWMDAK